MGGWGSRPRRSPSACCVRGPLDTAGNIVEAAKLLGVTRHALKRRIVKHNIVWPWAMDVALDRS